MSLLWSEKHQPKCERDLVVTKKKVAEVRDFLSGGSSSGRRLLVLRGPTGCGKAAVLRALCNELGFEIAEWTVAVRGGPAMMKSGPQGEVLGLREGLGDTFLRFMAQADRYQCLREESKDRPPALPGRPRVTLVRDFPFTLLEPLGGSQSQSQSQTRLDFLARFHTMLRGGAVQRAVFCFNDSVEDHRVISKLFGQLERGSVCTVNFDGVPRTFAQRALDVVLRAEGLESTTHVAGIAAACGGDLRHGVNALQLLSGRLGQKGMRSAGGPAGRGGRGRGARGLRPPTPQGGASGSGSAFGTEDKEGESTSASASTSASRSAGGASSSAEGLGPGLRGSSLGLFHALGRFLYCKRLPPPPPAAGQSGAQGLGAELPAESQPPAAKRRRCGPAGEASAPEPRQLPPELLVPKARRPPLYYVPEEVLEASGSEPVAVVDWLFTNAPRFFGDVEHLADFASTLSEVDAWHAAWQPGGASQGLGQGQGWLEGLAPSVQVRSLLDANLHPVPPSFADPCGAGAGPGSPAAAMSSKSSSGGGLAPASVAFNMARPLMRDVWRHRQRRCEELNSQLGALGPLALGGGSAGPRLCTGTLPFVHLMLAHSMGMHPTLRLLPHPLMQTIKDLSEPIDHPCFLGSESFEKGASCQALSTGSPLPPEWASALAEDPIESSDG